MNRRHFLTVTALGLTAAAPARAFTIQSCDNAAGSLTCTELARHDETLAKLDAMLAEKGLSEDQRKATLALARCPFCGALMVG